MSFGCKGWSVLAAVLKVDVRQIHSTHQTRPLRHCYVLNTRIISLRTLQIADEVDKAASWRQSNGTGCSRHQYFQLGSVSGGVWDDGHIHVREG